MTEPWPICFSGNYTVEDIDSSVKEWIKATFNSKEIKVDNYNQFFSGISSSLCMYNMQARMEKYDTPLDAKKHLAKTLKSAKDLYKNLNSLSGTTELKADNLIEADVTSFKNNQLLGLISALEKVSSIAQYNIKKGKPVDDKRSFLAAELAYNFRTILKLEPTATRGGLYELVLAIIIELATGKEVKSVHEIALKGIKKKIYYGTWIL